MSVFALVRNHSEEFKARYIREYDQRVERERIAYDDIATRQRVAGDVYQQMTSKSA